MVLADTSKGDIGWKKFVVAGWAFMECLLFAGHLYGWASINYVLKAEGIYACEDTTNGTVVEYSNGNNDSGIVYSDINETIAAVNVVALNTTADSGKFATFANGSVVTQPTSTKKEEPCKSQDSLMALCFTVGAALFCVGCAVLGHVNYKFGTRATRLISFVMYISGCLMMAFISKETPWLMFPGLSLIGIGGLPILVTNMQVSNLFLVGSSSVVGLLCGGFDMSSAVMLMVKIAYEHGFARQNMFIIIAIMHVLLLVSTFFFLPKDFITKPEVKKGPESELPDDGEAGIELLKKTPQTAEETKPELPSLKSCLLQPLFITHNIWLCLLQLRFYYFIGTLNTYLSRLLDEDKEQVSYFTDICFYTMMGGLLTSFLSGFVYDWQKRICADGKSQMYREVMPAVFPLALACLMSVLLSVLVLIPVINLLYIIFIVMTIYRSFLYSLAAAFLSAIFPSEYFGILYGVMIVSGGLFSCLQYAFFSWAEAYPEGAQHANIFLLCLVLLSFVHPLYLYITCWKEEKKVKIN